MTDWRRITDDGLAHLRNARLIQEAAGMTDYVRLTRTCRGWARAWAALEAAHGPPDYVEEGQTWQYMGASLDGGSHCFRHRCFKGERTYFMVSVEPDDGEELIE